MTTEKFRIIEYNTEKVHLNKSTRLLLSNLKRDLTFLLEADSKDGFMPASYSSVCVLIYKFFSLRWRFGDDLLRLK